VCTACPLLCADIDLPAAAALACLPGRQAMLAPVPALPPSHDGRALAPTAALDAAATLLTTARRVLVTGLGEATLGALAAAGDIAEFLGAAIDAGDPAVALASGPTIARSGEVTAAFEELRDRADVVVVWFADPATSHPRFFERFLPPRARVIQVGPAATIAPGESIAIPPADEVTALRWLTAQARGVVFPLPAGDLATAVARVRGAVAAATCLGIVTVERPAGSGVAEWALAEWVRAEAHRRPAFAIPLAGGVGTASGNAAGVAAVSTWRYGGPGAIARADRSGGTFRPAEADAVRLIARGEVDAVLVIGRPRPTVAAALRAADARLACVEVGPERTCSRGIHLPTAAPLDDPGEWLRGDGRLVHVPGRYPAAADQRLENVLRSLAAALAQGPEARR
jgi:formylmethanofuran dehydrogenase subunit B